MMHNFFLQSNGFSVLPFGIGWGIFLVGSILFILLMLLTVALKGYALWHAARRNEPVWFIVLLLVNTVGILELVYLYFIVGIGKGKHTDHNTPASTSTNAQ